MTDGWQPIETAPKDGTVIKIPVSGTVYAFWSDDLNKWVLRSPFHAENAEKFGPVTKWINDRPGAPTDPSSEGEGS